MPTNESNNGSGSGELSIDLEHGQFLCKYNTGGCERYGQEVCIQCREPFCPDHASEIDPNFCKSCLHPQSPEIEITKEPLIDVDGVQHRGTHLTPSGSGFKSLAARISQMTDPALGQHIQFIRQQVKEAEKVLDYRRIDLSVSQLELDHRDEEVRKKLRGTKITAGKISVVASGAGSNANGSSRPKAQATLDFVRDIATKMGVQLKSPEDVVKFATLLAALGKKS
jgi:hypothetical protein